MERRRTEEGGVKLKGLVLVCLLVLSLVGLPAIIRPASAEPAVSSKFVEYVKELEPIPHPAPIEKLDVKTTLIPHARIYINGNLGFTTTDAVNGGGSGTSGDPYIIENWVISASTANGIYIQNTTAYFVVRNCLVENGKYYYGIRLDDVTNGRIENNTCRNNYCEIYLVSSSYNNLTNNTCGGLPMLTIHFCAGIGLASSPHNSLTNNTCRNEQYGIWLYSSSNYNKLVNNTCENSSNYGIYLQSSSYENLTNNTCGNNPNGIRFDSSSYNNLTNNTITSNSYGIYLIGSSSSNIFTGNVISNNAHNIYNTGGTNTYSSNQFNNNMTNEMLTFIKNTRTENVGDNVRFSVLTFNPSGAAISGCTTITISPSESSLSYSDNGSGGVTGWFTPTKSGTYSLNFTVTDENSNTTKRTMLFFVGNTASTTTKYYFRGIKPTHGQIWGSDCGTLLFTAPTSTETWQCSGEIQNSPDEIPSYPLANLSAVDTYTWYKASVNGYIGVQRYLTYDVADYGKNVDENSPVNRVSDYTWINKNFTGLNWAMDYLRSWYWLKINLLADEGYPRWTTFPAGHSASEASYATFTYSFTTTPIIKSISNSDMAVLSATELVGDNNATIVLDGTGSTNIVLDNYKRPFSGYTTTINSDNTATIAANNLTGTTTINSVAMDITPSSGYIGVSIDNWNTSGTYYKKWTETGSSPSITANHTIGNLKENTNYKVTVNGVTFGIYQSNSSSQITFTYDGGYSTKTFEIEELPGQPTLYLPADGTLTNDNTPHFEWTCGSNTDSHRLLVDNDLELSSPEENQMLGATDNTYTIADENSLPDDLYYWKVVAINTVGENESGVRWFRVDTTPPTALSLISPLDKALIGDATPLLDWSDVSDASGVTYHLQVSRGKAFNQIVYEKSGILQSQHELESALQNNGMYFWRVRAVDGMGNVGGWSDVWQFRVDTRPPGTPWLIWPWNDMVIRDNTLLFVWFPVYDTSDVTYTLQVSAKPTFTNPIERSNLTSIFYRLNIMLPNGTYYWRVRAVDGAGNVGNWSNAWRFRVSKVITVLPPKSPIAIPIED